MGLFDVKCAVSGLIFRSGRAVIVPLVRQGKRFVAVGLPIAGEYDGYGRLDPVDDDPLAAHFAKRFVARAKFTKPKKSGLKAFVRQLCEVDQVEPELDGKAVALAYVHRGVYEALVNDGAARAPKGGKRATPANVDDLIATAFLAPDETRALYADLPSELAQAFARALRDFAHSGLGQRAITPRKVADYTQASEKQLANRLAKARLELADIRGMNAVLDDYERSAIKDEDPEAAEVVPLVRSLLAKSKLGLKPKGNGFERKDGAEHLRADVIERGEIVEVFVELSIDGLGSARRCVSRLDTEYSEEEVAESIQHFEANWPNTHFELRALAGAKVPIDVLVERAKTSRWFMAEVAGSPAIAPATLTTLALAMKRFPYSEDVRLAWIKMLERRDCPIEIANALSGHTSKSVKDAVAIRLARR